MRNVEYIHHIEIESLPFMILFDYYNNERRVKHFFKRDLALYLRREVQEVGGISSYGESIR